MTDSIAFDRAAAYYDETRGLSEEGVRRTTEILTEIFTGAGPVLEVGVGTGQVAIPLHEAGLDVIGLDLSRPMLARLLDKAGGRLPLFPLIEGDAVRMPFSDGAFGGAYLRWVLHLIPDWRGAVREVARVVRAEGSFLAALGASDGAQSEIQARFAEIAAVSLEPAGLTWEGGHELDDEVASLGGERLPDVAFVERPRDDLEHFMRAIEGNSFSWTWKVADDALRAEAAADVRSWAESQWGPLDRVPLEPFELRYAVYRLPGGLRT